MTKTRYRKKESDNSLNNNLAVNSSKTLMYFTNLAAVGIFSISLISHDSRKKNKVSITETNDEISNKIFIQKTGKPIMECGYPFWKYSQYNRPPHPKNNVTMS